MTTQEFRSNDYYNRKKKIATDCLGSSRKRKCFFVNHPLFFTVLHVGTFSLFRTSGDAWGFHSSRDNEGSVRTPVAMTGANYEGHVVGLVTPRLAMHWDAVKSG